jgi:hypothetical protein
VIGSVRRDGARDGVVPACRAFAVDHVHAMSALAREGGQDERAHARHLFLASRTRSIRRSQHTYGGSTNTIVLPGHFGARISRARL